MKLSQAISFALAATISTTAVLAETPDASVSSSSQPGKSDRLVTAPPRDEQSSSTETNPDHSYAASPTSSDGAKRLHRAIKSGKLADIPERSLATRDIENGVRALAQVPSKEHTTSPPVSITATDSRTDPKARLSASAQEVAKDLGIFPAVQVLIDAENQFGAHSVEALRVRQILLETVITASFEIRSAISRIDGEISRTNEIRNVMDEKRTKKVQVADVVNFINSGTGTILSAALTDFTKANTAALLHAGGAIGTVSGMLEIGISTFSLKLNKGEHRTEGVQPNMLSPIFGYEGADARFPPGVWEYLSDPYPGASSESETRQRHLIRTWLKLGRVYSPTTSEGKRQIGMVTGLIPQPKEATLDLLDDRALMLSDLRAEVSQMDTEMLEIIRWITSL